MTRRGKNEGSISKRGDGRWEARLTLVDGRRKSFYGKTRKEVADRLRDALADQARGKTIAPEKETVAHFLLERWLPDVRSRVDSSTHLQYAAHVKQYLAPALGRVLLSRLTPSDVQKMYTEMADRHLSPATIRLTHATLHIALKHALRLGLVSSNVSENTTRPRQTKRDIQPFDEAQANRLLAACGGHPLEALFVLAVTTGMRQGELLGLRWQDVNLEKGELIITQALQRTPSERRKKDYAIAAPKTDNQHKVALAKEVALPALRAHLARQRFEQHMFGESWQDQALVFPDELGGMRYPQSVYYQYKKLLKQAGLPDRRFHDLRHTAATILLLRGVNIKLVSEMLGHKDIALTLRIYGHLLPHTHEQAAAIMDEVFAKRA